MDIRECIMLWYLPVGFVFSSYTLLSTQCETTGTQSSKFKFLLADDNERHLTEILGGAHIFIKILLHDFLTLNVVLCTHFYQNFVA
jgi:hypothetical protein